MQRTIALALLLAAASASFDSTLHLTLRDPARGRLVRDVEVSATTAGSRAITLTQ